MSTSAVCYFLENYILTVWPECYLVEVRPANKYASSKNRVADLPDWVFDSRLAVWLTEGREEIRDRALFGDRVKRELAELAGRLQET